MYIIVDGDNSCPTYLLHYLKKHYQMVLIILYKYMLKLFLFTLLSLSALCNDEPTDFDYDNHGSDWQCTKNGTKQSPILLSMTQEIQKSKQSHLFGDYFGTTGVANYLNTTIYINTSASFGSVYTRLIDGTSAPFKANQIRIRMHSEHKTAQGYYDLEVQIFHVQLYTTTRNYRLAIGLLFNQSQTPDPFIQQIIQGYDKNNVSAPIQVDLRHLLPRNVVDDFWFYQGSATIPPCSQGRYHWVVSRKVHSITSGQKEKMLKILSRGDENWPGNWRNIQAQNRNVVGFRQLLEMKAQY